MASSDFAGKTAYFHLPGLFEFYDFYRIFLELFREHREYFYDWCEIASVYGAPSGCLWGGGRTSAGKEDPENVLALVNEYGFSPRLTFSNSLLERQHLSDKRCNRLCEIFQEGSIVQSGVIVHSELLLEYLLRRYPDLYFVSSTTKVITEFCGFEEELKREEFRFAVPDFRLNRDFNDLDLLPPELKDKTEFLCNECCWFGCTDRKACYENVSRKNLGIECADHVCRAPGGNEGYRFSRAMKNPGFIGVSDIKDTYLPKGFSNFKIEGRGLGSAVLLEFLLHYLTKPEYQLNVREEIYLDSMLDLF